MRIKTFPALRPTSEWAEKVASPPYDVVNSDEARALAEGRPYSFLRVVRSEIEFPPDISPYDDAVYQRAADNLARFQADGVLERAKPALYVYRLEQGDHVQVGVVTVCHVEDYDEERIKRHEKTRKAAEDDRARHVDVTDANTGPVFLTYRDDKEIDRQIAEIVATEPLYDFTSFDGVRNTLWEVRDADALSVSFAPVPATYIADGQHRAASAVRVAHSRRAANPDHSGQEEYNWFLAVLFPASQLRILAYNRCVADLNGRSAEEFLAETRTRFVVREATDARPEAPGHIRMFLDGAWWDISWEADAAADLVAGLDVSVLQDRLLAPVLAIEDPRHNTRIEFIGGVRGTDMLEERVRSGTAAVAFSLYPVTVDELMAVSDADLVMPPKSTWFEPKLKSGLVIHPLRTAPSLPQ